MQVLLKKSAPLAFEGPQSTQRQRKFMPAPPQEIHFEGKDRKKSLLATLLMAAGLSTPMLGMVSPGKTTAAITRKSAMTAPLASAAPQQALTFPIQGDILLSKLLPAFDLDPDTTRMPETLKTLRELFVKYNIDPNSTLLHIDPNESVDTRVARWGFSTTSLKVDTPAKFRKLILATLESYFRLNRNGKPGEETTAFPLSRQDRFMGHLMRLMFAHDLYLKSLSGGVSAAQADGSILFETAFAPENTGNGRLLRTKETLLSQLDATDLDALDGIMNGSELISKAAWALDQTLGTHYVDLANQMPHPVAKADINELRRTDFGNPFTVTVQDRLAQQIGVSYPDFIFGNNEQHALAVGGWAAAQANPPATLAEFSRKNAENALGTNPLQPFDFGFIERIFPSEAKTVLQNGLTELQQTGNNPFRTGADRYIRRILKDPTLTSAATTANTKALVAQAGKKPKS